MITIRTIGPSEYDSAKDFIKKVFPNAMVRVSDDDTIIFAEAGGKPVGFAHMVDDSDRLILQGLGVDDSARGQGIGTILLEYVISMFDDGVRPIYLKVKVMNPVIDLYLRYGFFLKKFGHSHVLVKKINS
ncbi:MAG: GNAT family N-acetyltransferase [Candidatus Micrarchaeota archaeon]